MDKRDFIATIKARLKQSEFWTSKTRGKGKSISNLICPECGDRTAWAYAQEPWSINCNRLNECGIRTKTLDLFPDLIQHIEKEHQPTKTDPARPATAYLQSRGLDKSLRGLKYEYWPNIRNTGSGGVMFPVGDGVYNGRIFNPPPGEGKTHNKESTSGKFWKHPKIEYKPDTETFITEGILDALSLIELGKQAIAVLSSGQDPSRVDLSEFNKLVFAFDNDTAGHGALKKWSKHYPDAKATMRISGDWNDLLLSGPKEKVLSFFEKKRPEFEFRARLALAKSGEEYGGIYHGHKQRPAGLFAFDGCYYHSYYNQKKKGLITSRVSDFTIEVDHYQLDTTNPEEPVNRYHLKIKPAKGRAVKCTVSGQDLASTEALTKMFLQRARALWEGDKKAAMALTRKIVESGAPVVRQLQITGHDEQSGCYVFKDFAIDKKGKTLYPNKKGFFELSRLDQIRPAQYLTIKPASGTTPQKIYDLIYRAWGYQGLVGIAWMVAGWFVHNIKTKLGFFPFLSFWNDTQTGKTRLTRALNSMQCLDEEGLPMRKVNTGKGEIRKLAQRAGLFKALLESKDANSTRFDIDSILTLYNPNPLQVRALKTNDIQTQEIPFLASLLFVQNREPFQTKAQKERVISVPFYAESITPETTKAFNELTQIPISQMANFFPTVTQHRKAFESGWVDAFQQAKKDIKETVQDARISENHALVLGFHRLLCNALDLKNDLKPFIEEIGQAKQRQCLSRAESVADIFIDILNKIPKKERWFVDLKDEKLYLNLNEALQKIKDDGSNFHVQIKDLQASLKDHPAYIESNKFHRFVKKSNQDTETKSLKAWVFNDVDILTK